MKEIVSPMPGRIIKINISEGEYVEENAEVIILESMKMEIPVSIQNPGKVIAINVTEGDAVSQGAVLLVME
ncbi:MAG: acetyl-CoA carboxylase biotin carboxyl carrier protein subunit [Dehalobacterium sp.]